jgi:polysaccharide pyruvyl transferase WcaK-like protein
MCRRESKRAFFLGIGVNDLAALDTPQSREILPSLDFIWTRDNQSYELLARHLPDRTKLGLGADLANISLAKFFPNSIAQDEASTDAFVINVEDRSQLSPEAFERYISNSASSGAPKIRWICQESRELPISELTIYKNLSQQARSRLELALGNYQTASLAELVAPWKGIRRCLSTRYHGALIAAWTGSAPVAFCRNDKVRGLVQDLMLSECVSLKTVEHIESALASARPVEQNVLENLSRIARTMCQEFIARCTAA